MDKIDPLLSSLAASGLGTKPTSPKGNGTYSYYTATHAIRVRNIIDAMVERPTEHKYLDSAKLARSPRTLMAMYKQGLAFLLDHADENGYYAKLWPNIHLRKEGNGIIFMWLSLVNYDPKFALGTVKRVTKDIMTLNVWRNELDRYLENALPGEVHSITGIHLTPDDQAAIRACLFMLSDFEYEITNTTIHIKRKEKPHEHTQPKTTLY